MLNNRVGILSIFPTLTCLLTKFFIPDIQNITNKNNEINNINIKDIFKTNNIFLNIYIKILLYIM